MDAVVDHIPTFDELFRIAPTSVLIVMLVATGFVAGVWVMTKVVNAYKEKAEVYKEWIEDLRRK